MHLAMTGLFRAKWSADVHDEWIRNLLIDRPDLTRPQLKCTRDLIPGLELPDPGDRHVLAAAIRGRADVIVALNLKHFPDAVLDSFGIEARHPDEFVLHPLGLSTGTVLSAARAHRRMSSEFAQPSVLSPAIGLGH
jgi:hypothetical protein